MSDEPNFVSGFCVTQADLDILLCYLQSATRAEPIAGSEQTRIILPGGLVTYCLDNHLCPEEPFDTLFSAIAPSFREAQSNVETLREINEAIRLGTAGIVDTLATALSEDSIATAFAYGFHQGIAGNYPFDDFLRKSGTNFDDVMSDGRPLTRNRLLLAITSGSIYGNKDRTNVDLSNLNVRRALSRSDEEGFHTAALDLFVTGYRGQAIDDKFRLASSRTEEYSLFERRMRRIHSPQRQRPYQHP